jgi:Cu2+-exporting ATPase
MGVMTFSLVLYGEAVYAPPEDDALRIVRDLGRMALAAFSLPVLFLLGVPLLEGAAEDLRDGRVRMDGLIVLAVGAAYALSLWHTFAGGGEVYYDTATMVLVLVTFGRRLEAHARTQGRDAADTLAACLPERAHLLGPHDGVTRVPPRKLERGDRVRVLPGEAVPADLVVLDGRSEIVAAHVTGEEAPVAVGPEDEVPAGAVNGTGAFVGRVARTTDEGTLGRIRRLLEAPLPSTRTLRLTDRLAGWLAAAAVTLAFAGGLRSGLAEGAGAGIRTALSVLLVACPCALGLAVPLAYRAMRAALAGRGVLVRDPGELEVAAEVSHVLLDKTGTLTDPRRARLELAAGSSRSMERMEALVGSSGHALAAAVAAPAVHTAREVRVVPGAGVEGTLDGVRCRAGSPEWMDRERLSWEPDVARSRAALASEGATLVAFAEEGRVRALGALTQELRPGAAEAVEELRANGIGVEILSGDRPEAVAVIAERLGAEAHGGLAPEEKVAHVEELRERGRRVLVAGDGVNDAPALRAADVGVAIATGTAAARAQAGIEVLGDDLRSLPRVLRGAAALRRAVRGNLAWTLAYNGVALAAAALGLLHPLLAVGAMIASSITVSARSYRLLGFEEGLA